MEDKTTLPEEGYIKYVDLEKVIAGKSERLLRLLPGFLLRYLKKTIHQDDLNGILNRHKDKYGQPFLHEVLKEFGANIIVRGEENLSKVDRFGHTSLLGPATPRTIPNSHF